MKDAAHARGYRLARTAYASSACEAFVTAIRSIAGADTLSHDAAVKSDVLRHLAMDAKAALGKYIGATEPESEPSPHPGEEPIGEGCTCGYGAKS